MDVRQVYGQGVARPHGQYYPAPEPIRQDPRDLRRPILPNNNSTPDLGRGPRPESNSFQAYSQQNYSERGFNGEQLARENLLAPSIYRTPAGSLYSPDRGITQNDPERNLSSRSPGTVAAEETLQHMSQRIPLSDQKSAESEYNVYEDVTKLRSLLSSAATELSRQILSAAPKRGADMDESFQLSLAQKKLAYLESKLGLAECETRESKRKALEALGRSAELEETTSELESRIELLQKEGTRAQQLLAAGIPTSRGKVNEEESMRSIAQSVELIKATRENKALREELKELKDKLAYFESTQPSELQLENDKLKSQLEQEMEKANQLQQKSNDNIEALSRAHTLIVSQKSVIQSAKTTQDELQAQILEMKAIFQENQSANKEMESKQAALHSVVYMKDARETKITAILEKASNRAFVAGLTASLFSDWKDCMFTSRTRRLTLFNSLSVIFGSWNRRFRKNHFLAWKFFTKSKKHGCDLKIAQFFSRVLNDSFSAWATAKHLRLTETLENDNKKLETDYKKLMEEFVETSRESSKGIDELRAELANRDDALKALRQSLEDKHRAELKSLQDKHSAVLSAEQSQLYEQQKTLEEQQNALENQGKQGKTKKVVKQIESLRSTIELLGTEKVELEGKFAKERSEIEGNLVKELEAKANVVKALETQLSEQRTTAEKALEKLEAQLATLKLEHINEVAALRSAIELLGTEKAELEGKFAKEKNEKLMEKAELEGKFAKERSEIEGNLVKELEAKANVVKALETQLSEQRTTAEKALEKLEAQLATLKLEHINEVAALRSAIELLGTEKAELEGKFAKEKNEKLMEKAELEGKFAKERSEIEGNLVKELEAKANVVKALETQLSEQRTTAEKALEKLEAQLATLKLEHIQELAELRVESKKEVVTLSNKFEEAVSSAKNWADVKMECAKEVESLNQKLAYFEAELAQAKSEAKASKEHAEALNEKLVEATNQVQIQEKRAKDLAAHMTGRTKAELDLDRKFKQEEFFQRDKDLALDIDRWKHQAQLAEEDAKRKISAAQEEATKRLKKSEEEYEKQIADLRMQHQRYEDQRGQTMADRETELLTKLAELRKSHAESESLFRRTLAENQESKTSVMKESFEATITDLQQQLESKEKKLSSVCAESKKALEQKTTDLKDAQASIHEMSEAMAKMEGVIAAKDSAIIMLDAQLADATQRSLEYERKAEDLSRWIADKEEGLAQKEEAMLKQIQRVQKENETMTNEMDTILAENAGIRGQLDSALLQLDDLNLQITQLNSAKPNDLNLQTTQLNSAKPKKCHSGRSEEVTSEWRRTAGVHTLRLKRDAFEEWIICCHDSRMSGSKSAFSCLASLTNQDNSLATWWPISRLKRENLDIMKERIGSGSFAEVFKGEVKIKCAAKKMRQNMQNGQVEINDFVREGEMMRLASDHPNIVKILGIHVDQGSYALILEYVMGTNLFDFMHKFYMRIPLPKQLMVAIQICDAMAYLHSIRIVHRDLKSQNVIYQEAAGICKLCDFGLARLMPPGVIQLDPSQLGTGGTPAYQGPEVLKRHPIGLSVDVFGFGIMIWEMFKGELPWMDCTLELMVHKVAVADERPPLPPDMPPKYSTLMQACWSSDPMLRPHFSSILEHLQVLLEQHPDVPSCTSAKPSPAVAPAPTKVSNGPQKIANSPAISSAPSPLVKPSAAPGRLLQQAPNPAKNLSAAARAAAAARPGSRPGGFF